MLITFDMLWHPMWKSVRGSVIVIALVYLSFLFAILRRTLSDVPSDVPLVLLSPASAPGTWLRYFFFVTWISHVMPARHLVLHAFQVP
jgi:hypothetical protein